MSLKNILGAFAIAGAVMTCAGCPDKGGAAAGGGGAATAAAMSDDDKHKLYQAGATTGDSATISMVNKKIGIMKEDGMPSDAMQKFVTDHSTWAQNNVKFLQEMNSPEKAKEYVAKNK